MSNGTFRIPLLFSGMSRSVCLVQGVLTAGRSQCITVICRQTWKLDNNNVVALFAYNSSFALIKRFKT